MRLKVNGQMQMHDASVSVQALVNKTVGCANAPGVAVGINGKLVTRSLWAQTMLSEADDVEILHAVAGG